MKKIERIEQLRIVEYTGNCPKCKKEITSDTPDVDEVLCYECKEKEENEKLKNIYKWLLDTKIIDIKGKYNSISVITVKIDNKEFNIRSEGRGHYLLVEETI